MRVRVEASGDREIIERLRRFGVEGINAGKRVLNAAVDKALPLAKAQTPYDDIEEGPHLVDTVRRTKARATGRGRISAGLVAGPVKARSGGVYPFVQHEDMTLKHDEGGPKFIERPIMQVAVDVPANLTAELDKLL